MENKRSEKAAKRKIKLSILHKNEMIKKQINKQTNEKIVENERFKEKKIYIWTKMRKKYKGKKGMEECRRR